MRRFLFLALVLLVVGGSAGAVAAPGNRNGQNTVPDAQDLTAPWVDWFGLDPEVVYTSVGDEEITITARVLDDLSGVRYAAFQYRSVVAPDQLIDVTFGEEHRIEGDDRDGIYRTTVSLPRYSALGAWELYTSLVIDRVGNIYRIQKSDTQVRQVFGNGASVQQKRYIWLPVVGR